MFLISVGSGPDWSLSKTLDHDGFILRMGRLDVGPVCCVAHVNEPMCTYRMEKGVHPGVPILIGCILNTLQTLHGAM